MDQIRIIAVMVALAAALPAWSPPCEGGAGGVTEVVRGDWYFRESLSAVSDWEAICERLSVVSPEKDEAQIPAFPVPSGEDGVTWPNPIPMELLPWDGRRASVRVRQVGITNPSQPSRMEVTHTAPDGTTNVQEVAPGEIVVGCQHPGGGGRDHWYHHYERRFDTLCRFRPQPAPFAVHVDAPLDLRPDANTLVVQLVGFGPTAQERHGVPTTTSLPHPTTPLSLRLEFSTPDADVVLDEREVSLIPGDVQRLEWPIPLREPGGGLLRLILTADGVVYTVPLFTYVERIAPVLDAVAQILQDTPDRAAAERLAALRADYQNCELRIANCELGQPANQPTSQPANQPIRAGAWRSLFEQACALRDELLLRRIDFDALLFVKRKPFTSEQPYMDAHHLPNPPGGGIYVLSPVRPDGAVRPVIDTLGEVKSEIRNPKSEIRNPKSEGIYRDVCLLWDARRLLFSFGNGSDKWDGGPSYHLYEVGVDGTGLRQLTFGPKNDCEPFYLPNGQIGFTSDRPEHFVMCGGDRHVANLHVMNPDGSGLQQLSFNMFNEFNPSVLPDGRILYTRWEYNERSVTSLHSLFTIHPDGTNVAPFYGNATIRPNVLMFGRAVPGSRRAMALFTAHHGQTHGPVGLVDPRVGVDGPEPVEVLTPGIPVTGEAFEDSRAGWCSHPWPLSEDTFLCSYTPTVLPWLGRSWALYVADRHGNMALLYRDPDISCTEPIPFRPTSRPHALPPPAPGADAVGSLPLPSGEGPGMGERPKGKERKEGKEGKESTEATLLLLDVYQRLPGVARGTARALRIVEDVPRQSVLTGGVIPMSQTPIYTTKRIFGTVPIEPDGSAYFVVPANRNVYFEVLDADSLEIQRMRSVVCLKPGERQTCIGCHEPRTQTPGKLGNWEIRKLGNGATEQLGNSETGQRGNSAQLPNFPVSQLPNFPISQFPGFPSALRKPPSRPTPPPWGLATISYLRDVQPVLNDRCIACHTHSRATNLVILTDDLTEQFCIGYQELVPYLRVANAMRWDHPADVLPAPPYTYGSAVSPLTKLLKQGHHGVQLTDEEWQRLVNWIDANGVYYDSYAWTWPNRNIFPNEFRKPLEEVAARRCQECHGDGPGQYGTWWMSLNRRDVSASRALRAPLARAAGGWGRCSGTVFANTDDPDYQGILRILTVLRDALRERPRQDLRSLQGTPAERQVVTLPSPPETSASQEEAEEEGQWVYLSDLKWASAKAGWTPNGDGLPRRDRDIEDHRLRLGAVAYQKGLGTHAPSEIVYRLDGGYTHFAATLAAAEQNGTVIFQVYTDGRLAYESPVLQGLRGSRSVRVPLEGVRELKLIVTDAGDGITADMANWISARVRCAGE